MQNFKNEIIERIKARSMDEKIVRLKDAAADCGYNHISRQDTADIVRAAKIEGYHVVQIMDHDNDSLFQSAAWIDDSVEFDDGDAIEPLAETGGLKTIVASRGSAVGEQFDEMKVGEQFVYEVPYIGAFPAWKVTDTVAIFVNASGRFIRAKRYANCLSIGTISPEYSTFAEAADVTDDWREANV